MNELFKFVVAGFFIIMGLFAFGISCFCAFRFRREILEQQKEWDFVLSYAFISVLLLFYSIVSILVCFVVMHVGVKL